MLDRAIEDKDYIILNVAFDDMPKYLSLADAGLFFYKPTFSRLANSPTKLGEYLASGLPVILNKNIGDTENLVKTNRVGVVIEEFGPGDYSRAVDDLLLMLQDKPNLRRRCRQTAERFLSLDYGVEKYWKTYSNLTV